MNIFKKIFGQGKSATVKPGSAKPEKESVLTPRASELGISFLDEYIAKGGTDWVSTLKLSEVKSWTDIKSQTPEVQAEVCLWACSTGLLPGRYGNGEMRHKSHHVQRAERKLGATLLRSKLPFTEAQLSTMLRWCAARTSLDWENPVVSVIGSTVGRNLLRKTFRALRRRGRNNGATFLSMRQVRKGRSQVKNG